LPSSTKMILIVILFSLTYSANTVLPFDGRQTLGTSSEVQNFPGHCRSGNPSQCDDSGEFQLVGEVVESSTRDQCFNWAMEDVDATAFSWSKNGKCAKYGGSEEYTHGSRVHCKAVVDTECFVKQSAAVPKVSKSLGRRNLATCTLPSTFPNNLVGYSGGSVQKCQSGLSLEAGYSCLATCADGYHFATGNTYAIILCSSSGISGWPACVADPDPCSVPAFPAASNLMGDSGHASLPACLIYLQLQPSHGCAYKCAPGFILAGNAPSATALCSSQGVMGGFGSCYPEPDACTFPALGDGMVGYQVNGNTPECFNGKTLNAGGSGNKCGIACEEGYYLSTGAEHATVSCNWIGTMSDIPTCIATEEPTNSPSQTPSAAPTMMPTPVPTGVPSQSPSASPTVMPTPVPTGAPSQTPSVSPTMLPTPVPTGPPCQAPSVSPSAQPSLSPSASPTSNPSTSPTSSPSSVPSNSPTTSPSSMPTNSPTTSPSTTPSESPSVSPSNAPSHQPTNNPTQSPSQAPSAAPTATAASKSQFYEVDMSEHHIATLLFLVALLFAGTVACLCRRRSKNSEKDLEAADGSTMATYGSSMEMVALGSILTSVSGTDLTMSAVESQTLDIQMFPSPTPGGNSDNEEHIKGPVTLELVDEISREVVKVDSDSEPSLHQSTWLGDSDSEVVNKTSELVDSQLTE